MHFANTFVRFLEEQDDLLQQRLEQGFEQGIEQGFEQGIEQGKLRERRAMLAKLLHLRFGEREGREAWLAALSLDALDHAVELVLSAEDEQQLIRTLDPST